MGDLAGWLKGGVPGKYWRQMERNDKLNIFDDFSM